MPHVCIGGKAHISIHAPRTGSDSAKHCLLHRHADFNPRSPHGERPVSEMVRVLTGDFNPRSPHGERRQRTQRTRQKRRHFNPRSPHGERPRWDRPKTSGKCISIHAPRTGSDFDTIQDCIHKVQFQSTLPARGATVFQQCRTRFVGNFNPRSPHGERRAKAQAPAQIAYFNPRSPHGERRSHQGRRDL